MLNQNLSLTNYIQPTAKGTVLFHEGDTDVEMYFVLKGTVELRKTYGSTIVSEAVIEQGGFFGEMSFVEGEPRGTTAITTCDSILMVINKDNFNEVLSKNPQLALHIITGLCLRIRDLTVSLDTADKENLPGNSGLDEAQAVVSELEEELSVFEETATASLIVDDTSAPEVAAPVSDVPEKDSITKIVSNKIHGITPELYNRYCFSKELACPVCEQKFATDMIRESRLKTTERTDELRTFYQDIEPLFYNVWICPNCYYSMKRTDFDSITEIQKRNLANQSEQRRENWSLDFSNNLSYDFAVTMYRIAIECCDSLGKKNIEDRIAGLWLYTAWLYDDMDQPENAREARINALTKYKNAYIFGTDRTDEQDQKIEYLIGKLSWVLGNIKEARDHFFKVVNRRDGHQLLKQMARDGLAYLKTLQQQ